MNHILCYWIIDYAGIFQTTCNNRFRFGLATVNEFEYCPYCGIKLCVPESEE